MKLFLSLLLFAAVPLSAQEAASQKTVTNTSTNVEPAKGPMPSALSSAALSVHVGTQRKTYEETIADTFLNKTFVSRTMPDGSLRTYHYKEGIIEGNLYILPVEVRTAGRLQVLMRYFFRMGADPALTRWEEVNYLTRQVAKYSSFSDVLKGVEAFRALLPKPAKAEPLAEETPPAQETPKT